MGKCICCGAAEDKLLTDKDGIRYCPYCGYEENNNISREALLQIKKSSLLREAFRFTHAQYMLKGLLQNDPENPTYNWYMLLADYQISYIDNNSDREPTFLDAKALSPIPESKYFKYLTDRRKQIALKLEELRINYTNQEKKVEPYDVFISYKKHSIADATRETKEARWANQLYHYLDKKGYKVFYDEEVLNKSNAEWQPHIYGALKSAKILIILGSSVQNIEAYWVKNEWKRYLAYKRIDKSKQICLLGLNVNPMELSDSDLRLNQMVNADDGTWLMTLEGRVRDACDIEKAKIEAKKPTKPSFEEKLIELTDNYNQAKDMELDRINRTLPLPNKRARAIERFNQIYESSYQSNTISSKEIALSTVIDYDLDSLDSLFNLEGFKSLKSKTIYSQIVKCNDNIDFITRTISFCYNMIIDNYKESYASRLFLDILPFNIKERGKYLEILYPLVKNEANASAIFEHILQIRNLSPEDEERELLDYASLELKVGRFDLAFRYASQILKGYDNKCYKAQEIKFLSSNKAKDFPSLFNYKRVMEDGGINLQGIKTLSDRLGINECMCKSCNEPMVRLFKANKYYCRECKIEEEIAEPIDDSITLYDKIITSINDGMPASRDINQIGFFQNKDSLNNAYIGIIDKVISFYPIKERKYRILYIAKALQAHELYKSAIKYYLDSLGTGLINDSEVYYNLVLCDLGKKTINNIIDSKISLKRSIYYEKLLLSLGPDSEEAIKLKDIQARIDESLTNRASNSVAGSSTITTQADREKREIRQKELDLKVKRVLRKRVIVGVIFNLIMLALFIFINTQMDYETLRLVIPLPNRDNVPLLYKIVSGVILFEILACFSKKRLRNRGFLFILLRLITITYIIGGFIIIYYL